ncbi:long-chain fatty acid--CoA ligase [Natronospirillum operosum]|uniref:Long-chain-fatty-acid--CoA ligase n=1 Tax=Natronospirillum operosum TaxID=2759953 RepID=A0A4Z0WBN0_9GAMM|nr:AMP-binding protein [Natronospirillum operosum]TGG95552.1 long-chain fatty acid--CoA ligase [Natronospirillum operosum]
MAAKLPQVTYPEGMNATIDLSQFQSVPQLLDRSLKEFADKPAFSCMGRTLTYGELDRMSADFGAWLQNHTDLEPGDRIAVQLPNILQYPVVVFGAMRAGLVVVNTNPLYTEREMEHQFNDSGARLLVVYAGMADKAVRVKGKTPIEQILCTEIADFHPPLKRLLINTVVKKIKKMVPAFDQSAVTPLRQALAQGAASQFNPVERTQDDLAVLQYTGGTTGVAKGAELTHRNLIANMLQCYEFFKLALTPGEETLVAPLPLYHIYAFTVHCLVVLETGNHNVLIPNPRDIPGFVKELRKWQFSGFAGLNTLFVALMNNEDFQQLDFSKLKLTISGGMALTRNAAERWEKMTGCTVSEGYGLTETSPVVSFNPPGHAQLGTIGLPAPDTEVRVVNDAGEPQPVGEPGELCVRGPQVMRGYWNRPEETEKSLTSDGWFSTGDIAVIQEDGYMRIVDRKKDMVVVSGFNVYPNEVEDVLVQHEAVVESAVIGVPDEKTGEAVKAFVVTNREVSDEELVRHCKEHLTAYKVPRLFERRDELPKTPVGKVLRRELRDD